jgi:hypothetical protein
MLLLKCRLKLLKWGIKKPNVPQDIPQMIKNPFLHPRTGGISTHEPTPTASTTASDQSNNNPPPPSPPSVVPTPELSAVSPQSVPVYVSGPTNPGCRMRLRRTDRRRVRGTFGGYCFGLPRPVGCRRRGRGGLGRFVCVVRGGGSGACRRG